MVRISLKTKAIALLCAMSLGPVALSVVALVDANRQPISDSEMQLQAAVISEIATTVSRTLHVYEEDADAVAFVLSQAGRGAIPDDSVIDAVRALIATRESVEAVRFEVPEAKVSTVIHRRKGGSADVSESTEALRAAADERGFAFERTGPEQGRLVVPIPAERGERNSAEPSLKPAPRGYVTVNVAFAGLNTILERAANVRFANHQVSLIVADERRNAVASFGIRNVSAGTDTAALPIWQRLPLKNTWANHFSVVDEHEFESVPVVGTIESIPDFGLGVALWRPKPVAFAALTSMRERGLWVSAVSVLFALVVGFLVAHSMTRPVLSLVGTVRLIGKRRFRDLSPLPPREDEIGELARSVEQMAHEIEASEENIAREAKLRGDLSRFVSKELVDAIVRGEHSMALGGKRTAVTVIFADVVAFTPLAESRPAEQVVALLNELFSMLSEIVFRHGGTVDKFIGDCIMAVWGAPVSTEDHASRALFAAEDMMRFLDAANEQWRAKYNTEIRLGIGVNSGDAIVGNIGSDKRMEYTVVGDVVNVAARLEAIAAPNQVLVAEATRRLVSDEGFMLKALGERTLTGRKNATTVYELDIG